MRTHFMYYEDEEVKVLNMEDVRKMFDTEVDQEQKDAGTTFDSWLCEMEHMQILNRTYIVSKIAAGIYNLLDLSGEETKKIIIPLNRISAEYNLSEWELMPIIGALKEELLEFEVVHKVEIFPHLSILGLLYRNNSGKRRERDRKLLLTLPKAEKIGPVNWQIAECIIEDAKQSISGSWEIDFSELTQNFEQVDFYGVLEELEKRPEIAEVEMSNHSFDITLYLDYLHKNQ